MEVHSVNPCWVYLHIPVDLRIPWTSLYKPLTHLLISIMLRTKITSYISNTYSMYSTSLSLTHTRSVKTDILWKGSSSGVSIQLAEESSEYVTWCYCPMKRSHLFHYLSRTTVTNIWETCSMSRSCLRIRHMKTCASLNFRPIPQETEAMSIVCSYHSNRYHCTRCFSDTDDDTEEQWSDLEGNFFIQLN